MMRDTVLNQVLLAGDSGDIATIRRHLDALGNNTYGQVYIEVRTAAEVCDLTAPPGVSVIWLPRDAVQSCLDGSALSMHGERIVHALSAWMLEWLTEESRDREQLSIWVGCASSALAGYACRALSAQTTVNLLHEEGLDARTD